MSNIRIALVDDDVFLLEDLDCILSNEDESWSVFKFKTAKNFLESDFNEFDVFFIDVMMRKPLGSENYQCETGEYLYRKIRDINKKSLIIVSSAKSFGDIDIELDNNTRFLPKPLAADAIDFMDCIREYFYEF